MRRALMLLLLLSLAAGGAAAWLWVSLERPYRNFGDSGVFVAVPRKASRRMVARILEQQGVIRSALAFELYSRRRRRSTLQAGEYFFDHASSAREVFETIAGGKIYEKALTIPEGATMFDIARQLDREGFLTAREFLDAAGDPAAIRDLAPGAHTLEGFLFPATYHFPRRTPAADVAATMVRKFRESWARLAAKNGGKGRSVEEVVTLASLVERETPAEDERPIVAGVFANRLRIGQALQCDPTVIYALESAGKYDGALTAAGLHFDSPYNTYRHAGLPPGPIANPGEASLRAALDPAQVPYFYFVANAHGGHFFGRTLAEHNRNVARYRRLLAQNGREPRAADPQPPKRKPLRKKVP